MQKSSEKAKNNSTNSLKMKSKYARIHLQGKVKGEKTLEVQLTSTKNVTVLDEIIDNASELPLESQDWLLMMAKSMRYTRDCIVSKNEAESPATSHRMSP